MRLAHAAFFAQVEIPDLGDAKSLKQKQDKNAARSR